MSKGSTPRPMDVDTKTFERNFERIFGQKNSNMDSNLQEQRIWQSVEDSPETTTQQ